MPPCLSPMVCHFDYEHLHSRRLLCSVPPLSQRRHACEMYMCSVLRPLNHRVPCLLVSTQSIGLKEISEGYERRILNLPW